MIDSKGILHLLSTYALLPYLVYGQSTTSQPQGHCANYLNRYTNENQCVYSFIVPKTDRDRCPGLEAELRELERQVQDLKRRQDSTDQQIRTLQQSSDTNRNLRRVEVQLAQVQERKNTLQDLNTQLQNRNNELETERVGLLSIQDQFAPLQRNHTQLQRDFSAIRQQLLTLQAQHESLRGNYTKLGRAKNCSDVNKHLPSCAVIRQWGYTTSGHAMIDPDGQGGVKPFMVYCDMDTDPTTGITVIQNDIQPNRTIQGCDEPGCLRVAVNYAQANMQQIQALMSISLACEQKIRYDCLDSKLLKDGTAWWESRDGERMNYWGGAAPGSGKCACGMNSSCYDAREKCNCDADVERWLYDEGYLRDKSELPVTALKFGDVATNRGEMGRLTIGALKCKWNANMSVPSCAALRRAGVVGTRVYKVDPDGPNGPIQPRNLMCQLPAYTGDFSATSTDTGTAVVVQTTDPDLYVFTDCGQRPGHVGPTNSLCNSTYTGSNVHVRVERGVQLWRVPRNGRYHITTKAPGGYHRIVNRTARGAVASGEFHLRGAVQMKILVGQRGLMFGGSGGTFVIMMDGEYTERPLIVSGGAGGAAAPNGGTNYGISDASITSDAKSGSVTTDMEGRGGTNGGGGEHGSSSGGGNTPGGGAGYMRNGGNSPDRRFRPLPTPAYATKGTNNPADTTAPGTGGTYNYNNRANYNGGFGGGGSGAKNAPGGAGGYSGGGGGVVDGFSGGGGSFVDSERVTNHRVEANNRGLGEVRIRYLGESLIINQDMRENN